jgi:hypothetical protein
MILLFLKKLKTLFITIGVILAISGYVYLTYRVMLHYPSEKRIDVGLIMIFGLVLGAVVLWGCLMGILSLTIWVKKQWDEAKHEMEHQRELKRLMGYTVELTEDLKKRVEAEDKESAEMEAKRTAPKPEIKSEPESGGGRYKIALEEIKSKKSES